MRSQFHKENPYIDQPYLKDKTIAIEGPIGVGKTSLARLLADRWKCATVFESFEDNTFLTGGFYDQRETYAFNTEIFFLLSRFKQLRVERSSPETRVTDYFFDKNWIFSKLNLNDDDWSIYQTLYREFEKRLAPPDLVVYLTAEMDTLRKRVYLRDRSFERSMSKNYLEDLHDAYKGYFRTYDKAPVIRISTDNFDFVNNTQDFQRIAALVEDRLQGHQQLSLSGLDVRSEEASAKASA